MAKKARRTRATNAKLFSRRLPEPDFDDPVCPTCSMKEFLVPEDDDADLFRCEYCQICFFFEEVTDWEDEEDNDNWKGARGPSTIPKRSQKPTKPTVPDPPLAPPVLGAIEELGGQRATSYPIELGDSSAK